MIRVSLSLLVFIYLCVFMSAVLLHWLWFNLQRRRREQQTLRFRLRCTICACEFEDESSTLLPRCPRCGSLNERFRFRTL